MVKHWFESNRRVLLDVAGLNSHAPISPASIAQWKSAGLKPQRLWFDSTSWHVPLVEDMSG